MFGHKKIYKVTNLKVHSTGRYYVFKESLFKNYNERLVWTTKLVSCIHRFHVMSQCFIHAIIVSESQLCDLSVYGHSSHNYQRKINETLPEGSQAYNMPGQYDNMICCNKLLASSRSTTLGWAQHVSKSKPGAGVFISLYFWWKPTVFITL